MHPLFVQADGLTETVIGAAIEVHKDKGPGLLESIYEWAFCCELQMRRLEYTTQDRVTIQYKQFSKVEELKFDILINRCLLVEVKAVEKVIPIHKAQLLSYMKLLDIPLGLLVNFNVPALRQGISRLILPGADQPD